MNATNGGPAGLSFATALIYLKEGRSVARQEWNGSDVIIKAQVPDANSKMTHPYLYIEYPEGHIEYPKSFRCPWVPSQPDLFADDWFLTDTGVVEDINLDF